MSDCNCSMLKSKINLRTVKFGPNSSYRDVPHLRDYSRKEIADLFYSKEEYANIKSENADTVALMRQGYQETSNCCFRGLEYRSRQYSKCRTQAIDQSKDVVRFEQKRQMTTKVLDHSALAAIYSICTLSSQHEARQ